MTNIAIIGLQWGDEGKGKIVDFLSDKFNSVVRFQGGHNAGHTIKANGKTYKLSLLPSGIIQNKYSVIGSGVVIDPIALLSEINTIKDAGIDINPNNLNIADNASLILSVHQELDKYLEEAKGNNKIGTTGRGIGPAYEDRIGRRSIRICDLKNDSILKDRLNNLLFYQNIIRKGIGAPEIKTNIIFDEIKSIRDEILKYSKASFEITQILKSKGNIMFEGAQGSLLDVGFGTYPFVTSSHTMSGQVALGGCVGPKDLDKTIGILKAYTTRVGSGPFPTELTNEIGKFLQIEGDEIGTVTGRDRRCGWLDLALIKNSIELSSVNSIILTKLDILDKLDKIKICIGYEFDGKKYNYLPNSIDVQSGLTPIYEEVDGWKSNTFGANKISDLPENAIKYIKKIEDFCNVNIDIISTGPKRENTIKIKFI